MFRNAKFSITLILNGITNITLSHVAQNGKGKAVQD